QWAQPNRPPRSAARLRTRALQQGCKVTNEVLSGWMDLQIPSGEFDAYIFDCDGTLVDSMPLHHQAWADSLARCGAPFDFDWELFTRRAGMGLEDTVVALSHQFSAQLDPSTVVGFQRETFIRLIPSVTVVAPVVEVARQALGRLGMAVCSGGE